MPPPSPTLSRCALYTLKPVSGSMRSTGASGLIICTMFDLSTPYGSESTALLLLLPLVFLRLPLSSSSSSSSSSFSLSLSWRRFLTLPNRASISAAAEPEVAAGAGADASPAAPFACFFLPLVDQSALGLSVAGTFDRSEPRSRPLL